jgi:5-methyltetrahydropteroyltriglutamate--homocysteine methyltransferase
MELQMAKWTGEPHDPQALEERLRAAVAEIVEKQATTGIDIVDDGEFSKPNFVDYVVERMSGLEKRRSDVEWFSSDGRLGQSKDLHDFRAFYVEAADQTRYMEPGPEREGHRRLSSVQTVCVSAVSYTGQEILRRDIANLRAALTGVAVEGAFMPSASPGSVVRAIKNEHYGDDDTFFGDVVAALHEEYKAIVDAGFICQIDDPYLTHEWDFHLMTGDWDLPKYRARAERAIEALNVALEGLPPERVRYHLCWGSWNGPHSTDVALSDIVDLVLRINVEAYVIEAANARHEWEYEVWRDTKLPDGKILIPGVIEHTTHVVEHPETVADRIQRFATLVGRENVIAGTDCGFRLRSHPQVAWAKLEALVAGAELASRRLWAASP